MTDRRHMRRREFIAAVSSAAVVGSRGAWGQTGQVRRIGVLMGSAPSELGKTYLATFTQRLEQLGWIEGRTARIEVRWWKGGPDDMRPIAAELLSFSPMW